MLTTPSVARCHASLASISATATLKCARRPSLTLRTTWRLSFSECAPSMRISSVRYAIISRPVAQRPGNQLSWGRNSPGTTAHSVLYECFGRYALRDEVLDDISDFNVTVIGDRDAAFHAVPHLADILLEASHRAYFALEHHYVVAQQANLGIALYDTIGHVAACNRAHLGNAEGVAHLGTPQIGFFDNRFEQASHGLLDFILQLVNDGVQADVHLLLLRQFLRFAFRSHIEADDDGVRRRGQQHVGFGNGAHSAQQDLDFHLVVGEFGQQVAQDFHRALNIALQNDKQFLLTGELQLLRQAFEGDA